MIEVDSAATVSGLLTAALKSDAAIPEGIDQFADNILAVSQDLVPVDTGELKNTGGKTKTVKVGNEWICEIFYTAEHALPVHEDLEVKHRIGEAKYLEKPMNENEPYFVEFVAGHVSVITGLDY